ncbi:MAG: hypothetical protein ACF8GE_08605 [Phycisphaerales bacterium JB043]
MEHQSPFPFGASSSVIRHHVGGSWRRAGLGSKLIAIVVTIALLAFLVLVVVPLALLFLLVSLIMSSWNAIASSIGGRLPSRPPRDSQGRRNVRVIRRD